MDLISGMREIIDGILNALCDIWEEKNSKKRYADLFQF